MSLTSCVLDNPIQITIVIVRPAALSKNDQIWPKIGIFVHFGPGLAGSFGGLVGGCGARAVSRKTPIYFIGM